MCDSFNITSFDKSICKKDESDSDFFNSIPYEDYKQIMQTQKYNYQTISNIIASILAIIFLVFLFTQAR
jgi:hypothetical protein